MIAFFRWVDEVARERVKDHVEGQQCDFYKEDEDVCWYNEINYDTQRV